MLDLSTLNPPQRDAVTHVDGPMLVLAGAGSGKTRVITFRIAHLLDRNVRPENVLAVSFTNKAAAEMRERVAHLVGPDIARQLHLSTFHALGARILREDIDAIGFTTPFSILDEGERIRVIRNILRDLRLGGTSANEARVGALISAAKNAMTSPARLAASRYNPDMPFAQRVFDRYNSALRHLNAVDFDDLLLLPVRIMAERTDIRQKYRDRFRYVMVDEYQDTNPIQFRLLQELVEPKRNNLVVVGDDDQSIYAFRGADSNHILQFAQAFAGTRTIALEQNYRSVGTILDAANAVIANNRKRHGKTLWSALARGGRIPLHVRDDAYAEAEFIAERIRDQAVAENRPLHHFAILYRVNPQARLIEEALRKHGLAYRIIGGQSLFDRKEVRDVLAYFRLLLNPRDELSARRVVNFPTRGIGEVTLEAIDAVLKERDGGFLDALAAWAGRPGGDERARRGANEFLAHLERGRAALRGRGGDELATLLRDFVDAVGLERAVRSAEKNPNIANVRWKIVDEMIAGAERAEGASAWARLEDFITRVSLDNRFVADEEDDTRNRVTLLTIHSSKGLEFPVVFLCGLTEELLPHWRALEERDGVSEERRLCYVGMTRAREQLILTRAAWALQRNERVRLKPSRFLAEIPAELIELNDPGLRPASVDAQSALNREYFDKLRALLGKGNES